VGGDGGVKRRGSICNEQVVTVVYFYRNETKKITQVVFA
jgi:hypothetical protein